MEGLWRVCAEILYLGQALLTDSGSEWPSTSVFEINSHAGVPLDKIVIGKPLEPGSASNGYVFSFLHVFNADDVDKKLYECF